MPSVYQSVAAWRQSLEAIMALGGRLSDAAWTAPTECPGWNVKDIYAHLVGAESWMAAGYPPLEQDFQQWVDEAVTARRGTPPATVLAELRTVYEQRRVQLDGAEPDPTEKVRLPFGPAATYEWLMTVRVFDVWTHEQDIRRAVRQPGNLASPAAAIAAEIAVGALPGVVARAVSGTGASPGPVMRLSTHGEVPVDVTVAVDEADQATLVAPTAAVASHITLPWEAYARLSAGRGDRGKYDIRVSGDRTLADRALSRLTLTP